jgi:putative hemolysin
VAGGRAVAPAGPWVRRRSLVPRQRRSLSLPVSHRPGPVRRLIARIVVRAADAAGRWVSRRLGASPATGRLAITNAELRELVASSAALDGGQRRIIDEVLAAGARHVREVMVPRTAVVFLPAGGAVAAAVVTARETPHSHFPVIDGTHDDVVGVVHVRDLLLAAMAGGPASVVGDLVRPVHLVPGLVNVLAALSEMRRDGHHLAVVVDEYGGTAGIVTLQDLIEELLGEVPVDGETGGAGDGDGSTAGAPPGFDGRTNLGDFAERCGIALPAGPYETVGGFVMAALGRLPHPGDEVPVGVWRLRVIEVDGRRVARIAVLSAEA